MKSKYVQKWFCRCTGWGQTASWQVPKQRNFGSSKLFLGAAAAGRRGPEWWTIPGLGNQHDPIGCRKPPLELERFCPKDPDFHQGMNEVGQLLSSLHKLWRNGVESGNLSSLDATPMHFNIHPGWKITQGNGKRQFSCCLWLLPVDDGTAKAGPHTLPRGPHRI